ncbi:Gpi-anchored adhesin-like protein [Thalictrum thalictroides]|uniref:Gpi-anchored adhesin-like protein n=1 Tax=Thalictrum thalictroides TaxID=46969 RepID=A0A7J6WHN6_THATH|nr:Gpi-anchored adhesin-like protein [Thalictrum thalictroides]
MGVDKQGSKGGTGGFLQLFDWNKKSRKKLFSNNSDYPDGSKQGKRSSSSLLVTRTHLIDEDDNGRSSIKGSSDYSCSSSVTDDEGNGIKAPGVVARLMGLDSLPTTSVVEPFSTPFFDSRSLRDGQYRRTPDFLYERQYMYSGKQPTKMDCFARNPVEVRPQKSLNRPIERFQTEILPPKSAKSISITHHKLFSPIKSPGYIPTKNAAQIMEEAARMIDPGPHTIIKGKLPLVGSSVPLKFRDLTEKMEAVPRPSRLPEASQRPVESRLPEPSQRPVDSRAMKHLKGQSLSKSWNGVEEAPQFRSYPSEESNAAGLKNKGKSISLAVQAKVNVQKRGGLNSISSSSLHGKKEHKESKFNQTSKSQLNSQKNMQKKPSTPSVSGVLRQNNQKQNSSTNRDKLSSKSVGSNQQGKKALPVEASFAQNKPLSKVAGNSKVGQRKSVLDTNDTEKVAPLSRTKNLPRKKRVIEGDSFLERSGFAETGLVNNDKKPVESNVAIEGHSKWMDDNRRKGMDVVSFTFTSPMKKPLPGQQASGLVMEKNANLGVGCSYEQNPADKNTAKLLSLGLNVIGGDALNLLLEQKLRELTNGIESSSSNSVTPGNVATCGSIQSDLVSDLDLLSATRMECDNRSKFGLQRESIYDSNCFSTEAHMLQGVEEIDENSVDSSKARKEFNCRHPSPVSVLEPCFSNESCNSSDSADSGSINDTLQCSSAQSEQVVDTSCSKRLQSMGADTDLSDSPSSTCSGNFSRKRGKRFSLVYSRRTDKMELEYVREVISNADFMFKDLSLGRAHEMVNPHLFDLLENKKPWLRSNSEENIDSRISRRVLFDCVGECLDLRCRPYVNGSCKKWAKGVAMVRRKGWLAEDIYKEIVGLRNMGNWMLDDLVDKDMGTGHGKWLDFETEEFELGEEIGRKILSSLVDEVVADILLV